MGYHIYISNKEVKSDGKIINDFDELKIFLEGHFEIYSYFKQGDFLYFYAKKPLETIIFYDYSELDGGFLWVKNPEIGHINFFIKIAEKMGDGSYVHGDEGEVYQNELDVLFNQDRNDDCKKEDGLFLLRYRLLRQVLPWAVPLLIGLMPFWLEI